MDKTYLEKEIKSKLNLFVIRLGGEKSFISFIILPVVVNDRSYDIVTGFFRTTLSS